MKRALIFAAIMLLPTQVMAQDQPFYGEVKYFPYTFCPAEYLPADGRLLPIAQNTELFSLLGNSFGGNGTTTFALPMLKPLRSESGGLVTPCIAIEGIYPARE